MVWQEIIIALVYATSYSAIQIVIMWPFAHYLLKKSQNISLRTMHKFLSAAASLFITGFTMAVVGTSGNILISFAVAFTVSLISIFVTSKITKPKIIE